MLLVVECIGFVEFVREDCIFSNGEVSVFSLTGPCKLYIPYNSQDDFHSIFFSVEFVCQVVTCAFDTSQFEVAMLFGVPTSLIVCTLGNIPFEFGWLEFYFAALYIFSIEYVLVIRDKLQF
jgi:hypothetical protein